MKIVLPSEQETEAFGARLWQELPNQCVVFLNGTLGAGKTTLVRGFLRAGGHKGAVKSPTYTLVEEYQLDYQLIYHFDLYRLKDPEELEWIGIQDYFAEKAICFIEWPEMGKGMLPDADMVINIAVEEQHRVLGIQKKQQHND